MYMKLKALETWEGWKVHFLYARLSCLQPHRDKKGQWRTNQITNTVPIQHITYVPNNYATQNKLIGNKLLTALKHPQVYSTRINTCPNTKNMVSLYTVCSRPDKMNGYIKYKLSKWALCQMSTLSWKYDHNKDSRIKGREVIHDEMKMSLIYSYVMRPKCFKLTLMTTQTWDNRTDMSLDKNLFNGLKLGTPIVQYSSWDRDFYKIRQSWR